MNVDKFKLSLKYFFHWLFCYFVGAIALPFLVAGVTIYAVIAIPPKIGRNAVSQIIAEMDAKKRMKIGKSEEQMSEKSINVP